MALNKQVHVYSVDTSAFYNQYEKRVSKLLSKYYRDRYAINKKKYKTKLDKDMIKQYNKQIKKYKNLLKRFMNKSDEWKIEYNNSLIREFDLSFKRDSNIVSVFDSILTRTICAEIGEIIDDIIIVQTYFYEVFEDIVKNGFSVDGEKYRIFTASAGQIRTKKTVFIKESAWNKYNNTLTCGLTIDRINQGGGVNVNKYLAYLALTNSATDLWEDFNIDKCIVVDDFETNIVTNVDYINEKTYEIKSNVKMEVPIPHMDGCGIILSGEKAFMGRAPWIKGLLVPFPALDFIDKYKGKYPNCQKIKDIYGKEYDIIEDNIDIIFTKSQFKMWKYYDSWDDYKGKFKKYNCTAGKCNEEPDFRKNAKVNYQMVQTLVDVTDGELKKLASPLNKKIEGISRDKQIMLNSLGVTKFNKNKSNLQQSLELYPQLLKDAHCKDVLSKMKNKFVKEGRSARLPISAKYTFLIPDLYAFCEWLFLGIETPKGLLGNGDVSCRLFDNKKVDVLRSPHLFFEHCIRNNVVNEDLKKWFISDGIYTSSHDPISKILMFDNDGDQALVCEDDNWVGIVERNAKKMNPLPLYYEMQKASGHILSNEMFYSGMKNAYSGGNIGIYSNDISKIWNSEDIDLDAIKLLCLENNFVIDYAKTLYKPTRPDEISQKIKSYTKLKTPHFFKYAKDKTEEQVEPLNNSTVNRLKEVIKNKQIKFNMTGFGRFSYQDLMTDKSVQVDNRVVDKYKSICRSKGRLMKNTTYGSDISYNYIYKVIREKMFEGENEYYVVDVLIRYLFSKQTKDKTIFWNSFGDIVVNNIKNNTRELMEKGFKQCELCGCMYKQKSNNSKYCSECSREIKKEQMAEIMRKRRRDGISL